MDKTHNCFYCDKIMSARSKTKDHIIPRMMGGTNHHTNKVKSCLLCNRIKANFMPTHLTEIIEWFYIPRAKDEEERVYLHKIRLRCVDLTMNHIPKYKHLMIKPPHNL